MSVSTLHDRQKQRSVLYCNTSDRAFGPVFDDYGAEDFLEWYETRTDAPGDVRSLNDPTLDIWVRTWRETVEGWEPSDTELFGAGAA